MSNRRNHDGGREAIRIDELDLEPLDQIRNARYGVADETDFSGRDESEDRVERLEDLLYDIALMADRHKSSTLFVEGENVALVNIRNMAIMALGLQDHIVSHGTLLASVRENSEADSSL